MPATNNSSITRALAILGFLFALYLALLGRTRLFNDADTLWHIAVGRTIVNSGFITTDRYSFTRDGQPWIANQWLAECALFVADALAGFDGVFVLTVAILTTTYLALGYRWLANGIAPLLTLTFLSLIISASAYTFNARPHIVSIGLLGLTFNWLRDVEDGRKPISRLAWLVPLFVLWSNLHGGVLGGLGTLGLVAGGWTIVWICRLGPPISNLREAGLVWLCVAGCSLALLATPYGIDSLRAWLTIMSMSLPDLVIEHAPLHPGNIEGMLAILLAIMYAAIFAATPGAWRRPTFWLPLVWFVLSCMRIRHVSLFAIVAGVALADLLPQSRLAPRLVQRGWLREPISAFNHAGMRIAAIVLILMAPLAATALWFKNVGPLPIVGASWVRPAARVWPAGILEPLSAFAGKSSDATLIFNEPILGGFLIYKFPQLRTFIDGRCELYGEPFQRDFVAAWNNPERVAQWQNEFGFRAALIEADSPLRSYFDNDNEWQLVAETTGAAFYRLKP